MGWEERVHVGGDGAPAKKPRVLVVDDDGDKGCITLNSYALKLERHGFDVVKMHIGGSAPDRKPEDVIHVKDVAGVVAYVKNPDNRIDAVLTDRNIPSGSGYYPYGDEIVSELKPEDRSKAFAGPVIVHSFGLERTHQTALEKLGAAASFEKNPTRSEYWQQIAQTIRDNLPTRGRGAGTSGVGF